MSERLKYEPKWSSLDKRPVAQWFKDAKFGIYIHWTVASVPAWGNHSSFYWTNLVESQKQESGGKKYVADSVENEWAGLWDFHVANYGAGVKFEDFAAQFRAELFDADEWAERIERSGAKYAVLTAKHHDGFCLWPDSFTAKTYGHPWNSMEAGPKRDLVGEYCRALRRRGIRVGIYFSFYEWFNPLWLADRKLFAVEYMLPQLKELITLYKPDLLWADGEWEAADTLWKSEEFLAWLFNESPVPDIVVNDRWGNTTRHVHGGFYTYEHTAGASGGAHPWEENRTMIRPLTKDKNGRPLWYTWVYNRRVTLEDYYTPWEELVTLVDIASRGGNLLLNIGPTPDGRIRVIEQERMAQIGDWLKGNGEAVYGCETWKRSHEWTEGQKPVVIYDELERFPYEPAEFAGKAKPGGAVVNTFFTRNGDTLYAISPRWPGRTWTLNDIQPREGSQITLLGYSEPLRWRKDGSDLVVEMPQVGPEELPTRHLYTLKISGVDI